MTIQCELNGHNKTLYNINISSILCILSIFLSQINATPNPVDKKDIQSENLSILEDKQWPLQAKRVYSTYKNLLNDQNYYEQMDSQYPNTDPNFLIRIMHKKGLDDGNGNMPGVLRFGKRAFFGSEDYHRQLAKKEMPGVLRFGKRLSSEKKAVPGVLRFGKRSDDIPGVLRFGKRYDDSMPGVLRFGKRYDDSMPGVLRFGKRYEVPGVLRFG